MLPLGRQPLGADTDPFVVQTLSFQTLCVFFFITHARGEVVPRRPARWISSAAGTAHSRSTRLPGVRYQEGSVASGGAALYYREAGNGRPLMLIHGTGTDADTWTPVWDWGDDDASQEGTSTASPA